MSEPIALRMHYLIHGMAVQLECQTPVLLEAIGRTLGEFAVEPRALKSSRVHGFLRPFDQAEVLRHLSPTASRIGGENELFELYEEAERFWMIDDHWGLSEINVLKAQWRSWILPSTLSDPLQVVERAVLWPVSQLLRPRGLCIIPAAAVTRDGWSVLVLSTFNVEPELSALVHAGWRVVGQTWTALREEGGQVSMLAMPGLMERATPRSPGSPIAPQARRVDLTGEFCGSRCEQANCDAVILVTPGRRPLPQITPVSPTNAVAALRRAWPLAELHPHRRQGQLAARIAQRCRVFDVELSRNPQDMLQLLNAARNHRPSRAAPAHKVA